MILSTVAVCGLAALALNQISLERRCGQIARRLALSSVDTAQHMEEAVYRWVSYPLHSVHVVVRSLPTIPTDESLRKNKGVEVIELTMERSFRLPPVGRVPLILRAHVREVRIMPLSLRGAG